MTFLPARLDDDDNKMPPDTRNAPDVIAACARPIPGKVGLNARTPMAKKTSVMKAFIATAPFEEKTAGTAADNKRRFAQPATVAGLR